MLVRTALPARRRLARLAAVEVVVEEELREAGRKVAAGHSE